jgi:hypothetical protein
MTKFIFDPYYGGRMESVNKNYAVDSNTRHYLMMPGDGTAYRFSIMWFPPIARVLTDSPDAWANVEVEGGNYVMCAPCTASAEMRRVYRTARNHRYVMSEGVSVAADYVKLAIDMPGGSGFGTVPLDCLQQKDLGVGYMRLHGFSNVDYYTLPAVLLAVKVLCKDAKDLVGAAKAMLGVREVIVALAKEEE